MDAKFANGLIGHRVEGSDLRNIVTVQGIAVQFIAPAPECDVPSYLVMLDDGVISWARVDRVILPVNEPKKPAEPYSIVQEEERERLLNEVLTPNGWRCNTSDWENITIDKDYHRVNIDETGVYIIAHLPKDPRATHVINAYYKIRMPLNEWVKNPTIESLKPKD